MHITQKLELLKPLVYVVSKLILLIKILTFKRQIHRNTH